MKRLSTAIAAIVVAVSACGSYVNQTGTAGAGCDDFVNAQSLSGTTSFTFSNEGYTVENGEPTHSSDGYYGGASGWAAWTAPATDDYTFWLAGTNDAQFDTQLAIYTGTSVSQLTRVASNDDSPLGGYSSMLSFRAVAGTRYMIAMDSYNGNPGSMTLRIERGIAPYLRFKGYGLKAFAPSSGCTTEIVVDSSADWSVTSSSGWITVNTYSGASGSKLSFTVGSNYTGEIRTGTITLQLDGTTQQIEFSVWQNVVGYVTTKAAAESAAKSAGKRILLVYGREECWNTRTTLFASVPTADVKEMIESGYVIWYSNCDRQSEAYGYASGLSSFSLPLICVIDPANMSTFVTRTTGAQSVSALQALLEANAPACKVTFNPSGGTVSPTTRSVANGATVGTLPTPTQTGYDFKGWWTAKSGGTQVTASTKVTANVTYYAHWQAKAFTVSFIATNGKISGARSKTVKFNGTYGTLPTATQEGYNFLGWFTERSGGTQVTAATKVTATADHTLYSHWKKAASCKVTFNATGGTVSPTTRSVASGATVGSLPTPTQAGYDFKGWWTAKSGGTQVTASTKVTANVTYYAHWQAKAFTVSFIATNGKISGARSKTVKFNGTYGTLPTATQEGYNFLGWFTARSSGTQVTATTKVTATADHTLYSHWKRAAN